MTNLQPMATETVRHYLDEADYGYELDEDGDFVLEFDIEELGGGLTVWLGVHDEGGYSIRAVRDDTFPRSEWDRLLRLCNTWNATMAYPTAYLDMGDGTDQIDLSVNYSVYLPSGVTQQQLYDLSEAVLGGIEEFYESAHSQNRS